MQSQRISKGLPGAACTRRARRACTLAKSGVGVKSGTLAGTHGSTKLFCLNSSFIDGEATSKTMPCHSCAWGCDDDILEYVMLNHGIFQTSLVI